MAIENTARISRAGFCLAAVIGKHPYLHEQTQGDQACGEGPEGGSGKEGMHCKSIEGTLDKEDEKILSAKEADQPGYRAD